MPVERHPISVSQFCELLAIDPTRFIGIERHSTGLYLVLEPEAGMNTSGAFQQLNTGGKKIGGKKGKGKRGC